MADITLAELDALIAERIEAESPTMRKRAGAEHARILASVEAPDPGKPSSKPRVTG